MSVARWPVALLIALFVFVPYAFASTYEAWGSGIYDAETDELLQAAKCPEAAVECAPPVAVQHVPVVAETIVVGNDSVASAIGLPARPSRAPPTL
jgi:hypothetical protein